MEEAAASEKREEDQPGSTEEKNNEKEEKEEETGGTAVVQTEGTEPNESEANSIDNPDAVNQTVNITVKYDETNQGTIDQEKEKCEPINDDNDTSQGAVTPSNDNVPQIESTVEKEHHFKNGLPEKEDETVVPSEEVERDTPAEVLAQVVDKESSEKDDTRNKDNILSEKPEIPSLAQVPDKETPEGENRLPSREVTEGESNIDLPVADLGGEKPPEEDIEKTKAASSEVTVPATPSSAKVDDKEPSKEGENENTTTTEKEALVDHPEQKKVEEEGPVSAETNEVVEAAPAPTGEGDVQQQPGDKDEEKADEAVKDTTPEGSPPQSTWFTGDKENPQQAEGYSTSVVGGVVMRKPLSSTSNEPKKPAKGPSTSSVFKKMSWGSLFGRRRSTKDKPNLGQQAATEAPVHDGTDGVQGNNPDNSDNKENNIPVDATVKEVSEDTAQPSEAVVKAEKPQENEAEVPLAEADLEEKDIVEGAVVPLEEGVVEEEKTTKVVDETQEQDAEHKDDVETLTDEDSLLRERIAKRESGTPAHSPTKHMQMRMSYAEGTKEVEVIGTLEAPAQQDKQKTARDNRLSCRELGEVDHEGWLIKRGGGAIFASWKRKWVVLKEGHVYYYKTSFDPVAGGVIHVKDHTIAAAPEMKKKFCFKIESKDPKAAKLYFAAESQEGMDRWISALTSASRGEIIMRKTQNQESSDVRMRKKSNSMGKRAGSVLGLGGYYTYDGQLEKTDQKRRASFGSSPKEAPKTIPPVDNPKNNDRSQSPAENATPSDIQKLLITKTEDDSVDAPVAMETPSTAPSKEEPCSPEVTSTVLPADNSEEQKVSAVEVEAKITSSETTNEECPPEVTTPEETIATPTVSQSETKDSLKDTHVATPSQPTSPSNTKWYYVLDGEENNWIDLDEKKAEASKRDSDELLSLVRTIKDARISIIGTPLPGNEERVRAMTNVSKQNEEVLKLREMKRTLKDKERDLKALEELLSNDINRQSIHEWKTRYSYLTPEDDTIEEENSEENSSNGAGMPAEQEGDEGGEDTGVREEKVGDGAEGRLEESKQQENMNMPEHVEVRSDEEVQDTPENTEVVNDGESRNDGGESKIKEDGNGRESPSKLEESAKDDSNDTQEKTNEAIKQDLHGESAGQTTEQNNNGKTNKNNLPDQKVEETTKIDNDEEGKKSIDTSETILPSQDQDSVDTRL